MGENGCLIVLSPQSNVISDIFSIYLLQEYELGLICNLKLFVVNEVFEIVLEKDDVDLILPSFFFLF